MFIEKGFLPRQSSTFKASTFGSVSLLCFANYHLLVSGFLSDRIAALSADLNMLSHHNCPHHHSQTICLIVACTPAAQHNLHAVETLLAFPHNPPALPPAVLTLGNHCSAKG